MDVGDLLMKASDNLSVRRAFGAAYEKDGMLIIPVAMVAGGGGGGTARPRRGNPADRPGRPPGEDPAVPGTPPPDSERTDTDTGGGFGGLVLPAGAYVVRGDQVRWVPAVDATIVIVASLALVQILARTWTGWRRQRGRR
jgi:uncharacterized spore protein YtfJ